MYEELQGDIPHLVVQEAIRRIVSVETIDGKRYSGLLANFDIEEGNTELIDVRCQAKDSSLSIMERVFIKGCNIRIIHLPSELRNAPLLNWKQLSTQQVLKKSLKRPRKLSKGAAVSIPPHENWKELRKLRKLR